jgi:hypothetical protein
MKEIRKINEIKQYLFFQQELIQVKNNSFIFSNELYDLGNNFFGIINSHNNRHIIIQSYYGDFRILENKKISLPYKGFYNLYSSKNELIYFFENSNVRILKDNKIITTNFKQNGFLTDKYYVELIGENEILNCLFNFYLIDGTFLKFFPLSNLGTYNNGAGEQPYRVALFAGIYQNTLICTLDRGGILLLDVQKGEVIKFFKDAPIKHHL